MTLIQTANQTPIPDFRIRSWFDILVQAWVVELVEADTVVESVTVATMAQVYEVSRHWHNSYRLHRPR